ncbi:MAG: hypothetical protein ACXV8I_02360 [Methylobacter sp.]
MNKNQIKDRTKEAKDKVKEVTGALLSRKEHGDRRKGLKERSQDRRGW